MSTTFKVFPATRDDVTFGELLERAEGQINDFIRRKKLGRSITLDASVTDTVSKASRTPGRNETLLFKQGEFAWITVDGVPGGTDVDGRRIAGNYDEEDPYWLINNIPNAPNWRPSFHKAFEATKELDRYWSFRRSMGQNGMIALSYGLIAASLAELTDGLIFSDDCGWEYRRFPATSAEFFEWYFVPHLASDPKMGDWAARCLDNARALLRA